MNINNYQIWKSKLQWGITLHQSEWPSSKNLQIINTGKGVEKREPSCPVGGSVNWYRHSLTLIFTCSFADEKLRTSEMKWFTWGYRNPYWQGGALSQVFWLLMGQLGAVWGQAAGGALKGNTFLTYQQCDLDTWTSPLRAWILVFEVEIIIVCTLRIPEDWDNEWEAWCLLLQSRCPWNGFSSLATPA